MSPIIHDVQSNANAVGPVRGSKPSTKERDEAKTDAQVAFAWDVGSGAKSNYLHLGDALSEFPDLFRNGEEGLGLIQVLRSGETRRITKASELAPVIADRLNLVVVKNDKITGDMPSAQHLNALLRSEVFLTRFLPVNVVACCPYYRSDFSLVEPGYHGDGPGQNVLYVGPVPQLSETTETIRRFLSAMEFESSSDETNTVAAALTVMLRHLWLGAKPLILVTATKSHAGKGTVTAFVQGTTATADILYESIDWPMQSQFQRQLQFNSEVGLIVFDNVRLDSAGGRGNCIRSTFIESFVTSPEITLASPGAGQPLRLRNNFVVTINTNDGVLSTDLMNRALPIHLSPKGDVQERKSAIGNPKLQFLPQNRDQIDAELRGMIHRWKRAGCPLDESFQGHPMPDWAMSIGGILKTNGLNGFLRDRGVLRVQHDPVKEAIAILGAARPDEPLRPAEWAKIAVKEGLAKTLFTHADRDTAKGRERGIGVVLKRHLEETFAAEREEEGGGRVRLKLRLRGGFRRWKTGKNPQTRYVFEVEEKESVPAEE